MKFKQVIVVRTDLGMGRGKIAAQVAHASVLGSMSAFQRKIEWYEAWRDQGMEKVVLKVRNLKELLDIKIKAEDSGLDTYIVEDRGMTQIPPNTITCICIGPSSEERIDRVTGGLKLL